MPTSAEVYVINAGASALNASYTRRMLDKFGDTVRFRGNKAQNVAYDHLMLDFADRKFPAEVNLDIAKRFGIYPSRFDLDESLSSSVVLVTVDGRIVAMLENLAIPYLYADFSSV